MSCSNGPTAAIGTKSHVLFSRLLKPDEYWALLGLGSAAEIASFLKLTEGYKNQMETIPADNVHRISLENAVRTSVLTEAKSFLYYLKGAERKFFLDWLSLYEAGQIKSLFRWLHADRLDRDVLKQYLVRVPGSKLPYEAMLSCRDYTDMLETLQGTRYYSILSGPVRKIVNGKGTHFALEIAIDNIVEADIYNDIMALPPAERDEVAPIFGARADLMNISLMHRCLEYYKMSIEETISRMLPVKYRVTPHYIRVIAGRPTPEERLDTIERHFPPYGRALRESLSQGDKELATETAMKRIIYKKAQKVMRKGTPGFHTAVAYFVLKDFEVRDIIRIIEYVRYDYERRTAAAYLTKPILDGSELAWR